MRIGDVPIGGPRGLSVAVSREEQPRGRPAVAWLRLCPFAAAAEGVVDAKIVALLRATSGSLAETADWGDEQQ
jgi:hypothetical protein